MKIEQGQIWEVTKEGFLTSGEHNDYNRPLSLKIGEKIEIRYPYQWHFRTEDGNYFHATPEMIVSKCKLLGIIWGKIRWNNNAKLEEILRLKLYDIADGK